MIAPPRPDGKAFVPAKKPHKRAENIHAAITNSLNAS
jgi:hypothetical protein